MPRRKSTASKRPLDPPQRSVSKRAKCANQRVPAHHQRIEALPLSAVDGWNVEDSRLQLQFPVDSALASSLTALCHAQSFATTLLHVQLNLALLESDQVQLQGLQDAQLSLTELFPNTYETWWPNIATLAEQKLLTLHINAKREAKEDDWSFRFSVAVAWRKYMEICISRGLELGLASPRATPTRAMHHVMIWLLKKTHDAQRELSEEEMSFKYRYWDEIEVLYDRFVGDNKAACSIFEDQTFAMPEIYARIDAAQQLSDAGAFEEFARNSSVLLPTLRAYQKAAVSWMLSREKPSTEQTDKLPVCITFSKAVVSRHLLAYDPFCAAFHPESSANPPQQEQLRSESLNLSAVRGGILADEMGLGKTVEVIALVLSHRRPYLRPLLMSTHSPYLSQPNEAIEDDIMACICGSSVSHPLGVVKCEFCGTLHHQLCTGFGIEESGSDCGLSPTPYPYGLWDFESTSTTVWSGDRFMCYHCQSNERPSFASRTTLIVSPEPIHSQWENEIPRHVREGALSVMRYPGVRAIKSRLEEAGPSAEWQVLASPGLILARCDVVLTTYEALAADLRHIPTSEGGDRRSSTRSQRKRYAFVSSPLVALNFWRVCMDEAQVGVENTRLQAALTLSRLSARNRWVVTGTPFSSRVSELFGYLRFLRIPPYTSAQVDGCSEANLQLLQAEHNERDNLDLGFFRESVEHNFVRGAIGRVLDLLLWNGQDSGGAVMGGGILWRTGKRHVLGQLDLPPQKSEVIWSNFTAVERHFYDLQEKRIVSLVQQRQGESPQTADVIERDDRLWQDLLVLRQLCCHPQVGSARQAWGYGGNSTAGTVMTMDAFLEELVNKATRECEEAQRQLIGAQNGLAGLLALDNDIAGAALKYMAEINLIRTNWPYFRADLLPRLHILQNLEKCIQELYSFTKNSDNSENSTISSTADITTSNPKEVSLLPKLPALEKRISSAGLLPESNNLSSEDQTAISQECALLGQSAQQIRQYYLLQVDIMHAQALSNFKNVAEQIASSQEQSSSLLSDMLCASGAWWNDALAIIEQNERNNNEQQLVARVQARLAGFSTRWGTTFCSQLVSTRSLRLLLVRELEALYKRRRGLFERLNALSDKVPTDSDVELSGNCAKCRDGGTGQICVHCKLYKELEAYRKHFLGIDKTFVGKGRIMNLIDDEEEDDGAPDTTTKAGSEGLSVSLFVEIFKEIAGCARSVQRSGRLLSTKVQTSMQAETDFWSKLQREWQAAKKLFQIQHQRLGALDELAMACSQLRLRQPGEPTGRTKAERLYKLERVEVPVRAAGLEAERTAAEYDLRDKMAQIRYLLELRSVEHTRREQQSQSSRTNSGVATEPHATQSTCAVCLQEFTQRRAVLPCAHVFCTDCIASLAGGGRSNARKSVRCPTCRRLYPVENVTTVVEELASALTNPENETSSVAPRQSSPPHRLGSLGSKLDALLGRVDMLRQENPGVKCLLFSQWSKMLELAVQALPRLGVRCFMYGTKRQLPKLLTQFQACPAACVLALPFKVGANGLNIVEATEVILIEPLLSTSIEAQAVNRVHRLGQTQPTRVHRFIVQDSIEERIYRLGHRHTVNTEQTQHEDVNDDTGDDDDEELQRLGVAPGRKEQEKLTMQDLQQLLRGNTENSAGLSHQHGDAGTTRLFWEEVVVLNERRVSRHAALEFLKRRHAAVARGETHNAVEEPRTDLFEKLVALLVADELLCLPYPSDAISSEVAARVDPQLIEHHLERVKEELRVWETAYH